MVERVKEDGGADGIPLPQPDVGAAAEKVAIIMIILVMMART